MAISWRERRQLIIFLIILVPIAIGGILFVERIIPDPSCFDSKRNQDEFNVDCGGSFCTHCALKYPKPITVFWARGVAVREKVYDVAAEIENPNELLSSAELAYEFTLFDDFGPVAKRTGKTFIFAQERALVAETAISTVRVPTRTEFKITGAEWMLRNDPRPLFTVDRRDYAVEETGGRRWSTVKTIIVNSTALSFERIDVAVAVLDSEENLLGVNRVRLEDLFSGDRREIKILWPTELDGAPAIIRVEPRANIFEEGTIIKPR